MGALAVDVQGGYVKTRLVAGILRVAGADARGRLLVNENSTGQIDGAGTRDNNECRKERATNDENASHRWMECSQWE
jgi:hypothetical protein